MKIKIHGIDSVRYSGFLRYRIHWIVPLLFQLESVVIGMGSYCKGGGIFRRSGSSHVYLYDFSVNKKRTGEKKVNCVYWNMIR